MPTIPSCPCARQGLKLPRALVLKLFIVWSLFSCEEMRMEFLTNNKCRKSVNGSLRVKLHFKKIKKEFGKSIEHGWTKNNFMGHQKVTLVHLGLDLQ